MAKTIHQLAHAAFIALLLTLGTAFGNWLLGSSTNLLDLFVYSMGGAFFALDSARLRSAVPTSS